MKKVKFNIVIQPNASYDEVVDSVADALEAGIIVEEALEDGFQAQDLFAALQLQQPVTEIINDAPEFMRQFLQLNPETSKAAVLEAKERIVRSGKTLGKVTNAIVNFLYVAANNYGFAINTYNGGQTQYLLWQTLLGGGEVFPKMNNKK